MRNRSFLILVAALVATVALYWTGLSGPFIFDDGWNLEPVRLWQTGGASWLEAMLPRPSIIESRPVAMASFLLSAWLGDGTSFSYKLGNLIVHLCCGLAGWAVMRRVLLRDAALAPDAKLIAAIICAFWLLHPLHTSTVLYAVQRMAQLSSLFSLLAVWAYVEGRQKLESARTKAAFSLLFLAFPLAMVAGVLNKQSAAVAPALCLVIEIAYFSQLRRHRRAVYAFFAFFLVLPTLAVAGLLAVAPERLLGTYVEWDFTLGQRVLTQTRALVDYIGMLLLPRSPLMGLYTDDFPVSTGLLSPPSTLICIALIAGLSVAAVALRKRMPSVFAGWFFFLAAHGVESSFLPLEMYYEHRNYLPSFGLLLAAVGLFAYGLKNLRTNVMTPRQLATIACSVFALALAISTFGRVLIWKDMDAIVEQGVKYHPESIRARFDWSALAVDKGNYPKALEAMEYLTRSQNARHRQLGHLSIVTLNCTRNVNDRNREHLQAAASENLSRLTTYEAQSFMRLNRANRIGNCGLSGFEIAGYLNKVLESAKQQPETATPKWFSRYVLAEMYVRADRWDLAKVHAETAWNAGKDQKVGALVAAIHIHDGQLGRARVTLKALESAIPSYDIGGQRALEDLRRLYREKKAAMRGLPGDESGRTTGNVFFSLRKVLT